MGAEPAGDALNRTKRIAIVVEAPPDQRDRARLGAEACRQKGLEVTFYDVSGLTRPHVAFTAPTTPAADVVRIERSDQLPALRQAAAACDLVMLHVGFTGDLSRLRVYRALAKAGTPVMVFAHNAYPGAAPTRPGAGRLVELWRRLLALRVNPLRSLIARLPHGWLGIRPVDFIVLGGRRSAAGRRMYPCAASTRKIWAHSNDYEFFRATADTVPPRQAIAVFIDENMCFQQDLRDLKIDDWITPDQYYPKLCRLFERIEAATGLTVVIAANPRAERDKRMGLFGNRRVEHGNTAALVARASLVIAHRSTAVGYAVMAGLPVFLCSLDQLFRHWVNHRAYLAFTQALGRPLVMFDEPETVDLQGILDVDAVSQRQYREDYVKRSVSPDAPLWDLVLNAALREC
ncbi:MAG: hypothetical protein FD176_333 [Rhodospirillaceae bacterium]|nr:MAG: hypothetical protein FD176_333 [Rhodospirillaceae bacterium]TNC97418.1 MAG: hypothetical protein FD119_1018 [Stygiobacter sp.]